MYFKFWSRQYLYLVFVMLIVLGANQRAATEPSAWAGGEGSANNSSTSSGSSGRGDGDGDPWTDPVLWMMGVFQPWLLLLVLAIRAALPAALGIDTHADGGVGSATR